MKPETISHMSTERTAEMQNAVKVLQSSHGIILRSEMISICFNVSMPIVIRAEIDCNHEKSCYWPENS